MQIMLSERRTPHAPLRSVGTPPMIALSVALSVALLATGCSSTDAGAGSISVPVGGPLQDAGPDGGTPSLADTEQTATPDAPVSSPDGTTNGPVLPPDDDDFGAPCEENSDCLSGWCIEGPTGYICTEDCLEECPTGFSCKSVQGMGDVVFLCLPKLTKLCAPCEVDVHCSDGFCVTLGGESRCVQPCTAQEDCPGGFDCRHNAQVDGEVCTPVTDSCSCYPLVDGGQRTCTAQNDLGSCYGLETCDPDVGWGPCTAVPATGEICDGLDNDCNGLVDEGVDEGLSCSNEVAGVGACDGVLACLGPQGLVCQGPEASPEICDYKDNDCDGDIDEDYKDGGAYADQKHCGACNANCEAGFPNASQVGCQVLGDTPHCVVETCEVGYLKLNDFQCVSASGSLCQPCADDSGCMGEDSLCVDLEDGSYCAQPCGLEEGCPDGYVCSDGAPGALAQCVPATGSCTCDGDNTNLARACVVTWTPADPDSPITTCSGFEACTPDGWGPCELPEENCDSVDNDCDGQVDEDFKNADGLYAQVQHCGGCQISCLALAAPHATPTCPLDDGFPGCSFVCEEGWFDVDGLPSNGCECHPVAGPDEVGDGIDSNCDGIEGDIAEGIFVAKNGNDGNPGTLDSPMATLQNGLKQAAFEGKRDVYAATGVYAESIDLVDGVGLYGGYSYDFLEREVLLFETAIIGDPPTDAAAASVSAVGLGHEGAPTLTVLDGFTIFGASASNLAGANSYGIYVRECGSHLLIRGNRVFGGAGGQGLQGQSGQDGLDGLDGTPGVGAHGLATATAGCGAADITPGGAGGGLVCAGGVPVSGGAGGSSICPVYGDAPTGTEAGSSGQGLSGGLGGTSGWDLTFDTSVTCTSCSTPPDNMPFEPTFGTSGAGGQDANGGASCSQGAGSVLNGHWVGKSGGAGTTGLAGSGGGGGGAGAGVEVSGTVCDGLTGNAALGTCCSVLGGVGCSVGTVQSCVCALDTFCCATSWDGQCVIEVEAFNCGNCNLAKHDIGGHDMGGAGGGGGSGGCSGSGGTGGLAGGGSFALFITSSENAPTYPTVAQNQLQGGSGGPGGAGGPAGTGGQGGAGAPGGAATVGDFTAWCATGGGEGANGGRGGHGGGGGGGCGGVGFALFVWPVTPADLLQSYGNLNTFLPGSSGGPGGPGGASLGSSGDPGSPGQAGNTNI